MPIPEPIIFVPSTQGYVTQMHYSCFSGTPVIYVYIRSELPDGVITCFTLTHTPDEVDNLTMKNMQDIANFRHKQNNQIAMLREALIHQIKVKLYHWLFDSKIWAVAISTDSEGFSYPYGW